MPAIPARESATSTLSTHSQASSSAARRNVNVSLYSGTRKPVHRTEKVSTPMPGSGSLRPHAKLMRGSVRSAYRSVKSKCRKYCPRQPCPAATTPPLAVADAVREAVGVTDGVMDGLAMWRLSHHTYRLGRSWRGVEALLQ